MTQVSRTVHTVLLMTAGTIFERALAEDLGDGDVTTLNTIPPDAVLHRRFSGQGAGCHRRPAGRGARFHGPRSRRCSSRLSPRMATGSDQGDIVAAVAGPGRAILSGERVALNFLQRMSGIATATGATSTRWPAPAP